MWFLFSSVSWSILVCLVQCSVAKGLHLLKRYNMKWCTWHWGEKKHYLQIGSDYRRTSVQGMFKKWLYLLVLFSEMACREPSNILNEAESKRFDWFTLAGVHTSPLSLWTRQRRERLRVRMAACWSWITSLLQSVSMVYVLLCCWGVFPVLTLYSPRSIVWGLFFFSSLSSCYAVIFFNSLSSCPVYPLVIYVCYVWAGWWLISLVLVTKWQ